LLIEEVASHQVQIPKLVEVGYFGKISSYGHDVGPDFGEFAARWEPIKPVAPVTSTG